MNTCWIGFAAILLTTVEGYEGCTATGDGLLRLFESDLEATQLRIVLLFHLCLVLANINGVPDC